VRDSRVRRRVLGVCEAAARRAALHARPRPRPPLRCTGAASLRQERTPSSHRDLLRTLSARMPSGAEEACSVRRSGAVGMRDASASACCAAAARPLRHPERLSTRGGCAKRSPRLLRGCRSTDRIRSTSCCCAMPQHRTAIALRSVCVLGECACEAWLRRAARTRQRAHSRGVCARGQKASVLLRKRAPFSSVCPAHLTSTRPHARRRCPQSSRSALPERSLSAPRSGGAIASRFCAMRCESDAALWTAA
jgi:hypothetical protein